MNTHSRLTVTDQDAAPAEEDCASAARLPPGGGRLLSGDQAALTIGKLVQHQYEPTIISRGHTNEPELTPKPTGQLSRPGPPFDGGLGLGRGGASVQATTPVAAGSVDTHEQATR